jgi:hypothetical protein
MHMLTWLARGAAGLGVGPCHGVALVARLGTPVGADLLFLPDILVLAVTVPVGTGVQQVCALCVYTCMVRGD